ncbi:MAG: ATPase domain-containing protein, partial [Candidatus Moraniibacteriota bacterium]
MAKSKKQTKQKSGLERFQTGIPGFDELLKGGLPKGRPFLVNGSSGTGKTVFLCSFLQQGIVEYTQGGVFVTFEERPQDIVKNVKGFGWDFDQHEEDGKLAFVDLSPSREQSQQISPDFSLQPIVDRIKNAIKKTNAERVVIDSLANLFSRFGEEDKIREILFLLFDELKEMGVTVFVSAEVGGDDTSTSRSGMEEYVADGVVQLRTAFGENQLIRIISILKARGVSYRSGEVRYNIDEKGFLIYPKIEIDKSVFDVSFEERKKFGISKLDRSINGGIPKGHLMLVGGNTGTGKTTMGMHFLQQGMKEGENCIWVALEESVSQLKKVARQRNWELEELEKKGKITFIETTLL